MVMSKRILVVDDELGIRCLLEDVLSSEGFEVSMARDGQESLDQLEVNSFDLIITDIKMPRLDGIEMLKWMKKTGRKEKVIVMSGECSKLTSLDAEMPHVVMKLEKPIKMDNFLDVVIAAMADKESGAKTDKMQAV
jgi:DNA-binding NtrC family response regulator